MALNIPGYSSFVQQRTQLMDQATDTARKTHFKAEIDLVNSWGVTGNDIDPCDITDEPSSAGGSYGRPAPAAGTGPYGASAGPPRSSGDTGGIVDTYRTKLPPNMPAVFDLQVGGTGKTLRQLTEDAAEKTGTPAIVLAGQLWQESKAGLWGKDAEFIAKYGKPGSGAGSDEVLDAVVNTSTTNPGNGLSDSGILQINPDTLRTLIEGGNMGGGVTLPAHPELAGLDPTNIDDALVIAGTLMKDYHDYYLGQSYTRSDADAWDYALRAYVGGPSSVIPGNPYGRASGGGDINYVDKVHAHMEDFANGAPPRYPA